MTAISQLQMSYSPEEDRVLLRLNTTATEEFRFWLTRRYCQLVVQALAAHRAVDPDVSNQVSPVARKAVEEFKQEAANASGNFKDDFKPSDTFPLGENPVLAHKLSYKVLGSKLVLTISPQSGQGVTIVLDSSLNFNITKLLKSAGKAGEWGLDWDSTKPRDAQVTEEENRIIN
ncbi:MAG: hypothetical protein O3C68_01945 [Proteobacteria bacterium]|nr:hypothetical protein [Pseudomonadota bacterium]